MRKNKNFMPLLAAFGAYFIWSFCFMLSKNAMKVTDPPQLLVWRFTAAFITANLLLLTGKFKLNLRGKRVGRSLLQGLFEPLLYQIFEYYGIQNVSTVYSGVTIAIIPIFVLILARIFLREKPTWQQVLFCALSIAGVVVISFQTGAEQGGNKLLGIVLMMLAVLASALFNLFSRKNSAEFTAFESTYIMAGECFVGFWVLALAVNIGNPAAIFEPLRYPSFVASVAYLGVLPSVFAYILINYANAKLELARTAIFANLTTVLTVILGVTFLDEAFSAVSAIASVGILVGIWGVQKYAAKTETALSE